MEYFENNKLYHPRPDGLIDFVQFIESCDYVKNRFRELTKQHHPDRGGSTIRMQEINEAYRIVNLKLKKVN